MLNLRLSTKFKKDYAWCRKRQYNMGILQSVVDVLRIPAPCYVYPHVNKNPVHCRFLLLSVSFCKYHLFAF